MSFCSSILLSVFTEAVFCLSSLYVSQILVLELNDEAAEQTVEAKVVDLLQGQEGFRWKVLSSVASITHDFSILMLYSSLTESCNF